MVKLKSLKDWIVAEDITQGAVERLPSGIPQLDAACDGGLPRGYITQVYGPDGVGKSGAMVPYALQAQARGERVLYIAVEPKLNRQLFYNEGVLSNTIDFVMSQDKGSPLTGDVAFDILRFALNENNYALIVVDSVPSLIPRKAFEMEAGDTAWALVARLLSNQLPLVSSVMPTTDTALVFINQVRDNQSQYGRDFRVFGGWAMKFYSSLNLWMRRCMSQKGDPDFGHRIKCTLDKNSFGQPGAETTWFVRYDIGVDFCAEMFQHARDLGLISTAGGYVRLGDIDFNSEGERGIADAVDNYNSSKELQDAVRKAIEDYHKEAGDEVSGALG